MKRIVWTFFLLSTLPMMMQLSGKYTNFVKKVKTIISVKKQLIDKVESFLKSNFYLNQGYSLGQTQNHQIWNF